MTAKESVLQALQLQMETEASADVIEQKKKWLAALDDLFRQFRSWMAEPEKRGLLKVGVDTQEVREERFGTYVTQAMTITAPSGITVRVAPKSRFIFGAKGRVDVECFTKKVMLILNEKNMWQIAVPASSSGWRFEELTEETFWNMLGKMIA